MKNLKQQIDYINTRNHKVYPNTEISTEKDDKLLAILTLGSLTCLMKRALMSVFIIIILSSVTFSPVRSTTKSMRRKTV